MKSQKRRSNYRCWLCEVEGHYVNECPNKEKKNFKIFIEEYEAVIKKRLM